MTAPSHCVPGIGTGLDQSRPPGGVMDASYAAARSRKIHLKFRLRCRAQIVIRAVKKHLPPKTVRLLEVGAADGRTLLEFASSLQNGEFVGIEYDAGLRAAAVPFPAGVTLLAGDAVLLPQHLPDASFDVVSMLALLEHLNRPEQALQEARRVLCPGGLLVATCPNPFWDALAGRLGSATTDHHVKDIDLCGMRQLIVAGGFEVIEARPFMWAPLAVLPYARIPVGPHFALRLDALMSRIPILRRFFVNAYVVARRKN